MDLQSKTVSARDSISSMLNVLKGSVWTSFIPFLMIEQMWSWSTSSSQAQGRTQEAYGETCSKMNQSVVIRAEKEAHFKSLIQNKAVETHPGN